MSIQRTPMIPDSETLETLKLAEEISTFFEDQKLKAQDRIRQCESFINNLQLPSKSVKEGLVSLRQNAEDDYSTLLHLERVLIMRDGGDFVPTLDTPIIPDAKTTSEFSNSLPGFTPTDSSGDHIGLSGGGSHLQKNARISTETKFGSHFDDDHGEGTGFEMGSKISVGQGSCLELDENFDPLEPDEFISLSENKTVQQVDKSEQSRKSPSELNQKQQLKQDKDILNETDAGEPCEEEDEEEDYFVERESSQGVAIGIRQKPLSNALQNMARSLPVSVPLPEGLPKRGEIFDLSDEDDEDESDIDKDQGPLETSRSKKKRVGRRKSAIPEKIAQIAKSMYDRDGLGFGESPPRTVISRLLQ